MVYLVTGKILRIIIIKFEVAESEYSLLTKNNIRHAEKYICK